MNKEIWKNIKEFPRYQVSNMGRIKSLIGNEKILKGFYKNKYLAVRLSRKEGQYSIRIDKSIHRLVGEYFCDNYDMLKEVHHINLDRTDNRAENLINLTKKENIEIHKKLRKEKK